MSYCSYVGTDLIESSNLVCLGLFLLTLAAFAYAYVQLLVSLAYLVYPLPPLAYPASVKELSKLMDWMFSSIDSLSLEHDFFKYGLPNFSRSLFLFN